MIINIMVKIIIIITIIIVCSILSSFANIKLGVIISIIGALLSLLVLILDEKNFKREIPQDESTQNINYLEICSSYFWHFVNSFNSKNFFMLEKICTPDFLGHLSYIQNIETPLRLLDLNFIQEDNQTIKCQFIGSLKNNKILETIFTFIKTKNGVKIQKIE